MGGRLFNECSPELLRRVAACYPTDWQDPVHSTSSLETYYEAKEWKGFTQLKRR